MEDVGNIGVQVRPSARSFAQPELSRSRWTPLVELTALTQANAESSPSLRT